jgi:hypothetical protein
MCVVWNCHSWIFSLASELLILSLLMGCGTLVNGLACRIWGDVREEDSPTIANDRTAKQPPMVKAA